MVSFLDPKRSFAGKRMKPVLVLLVYIMLACTIIGSAAALRNALSKPQWVHAELMETMALPDTAQAKTKVFARFKNKDGTTSMSPAVILERHVMMNGPNEFTVMWLDGDRLFNRVNIADIHPRDDTVTYTNYDLNGLTAYPAPLTAAEGGSGSAASAAGGGNSGRSGGAAGGGSGSAAGAAGGSQNPAKKAKTEKEPQNEQLRERNSVLETNNANLQKTMHLVDAERDAAFAERDTAFTERDTAFAERDTAFTERDTAFTERDTAFTERDTAFTERDNALRALEAANIRADAAERRIVDAAAPQAAAAVVPQAAAVVVPQAAAVVVPQDASERTSRVRNPPVHFTTNFNKCDGTLRKGGL